MKIKGKVPMRKNDSLMKNDPLQMLRINEASKLFGLAKSSFYDRVNRGLLVKSISLGGRNVAWIRSELEEIRIAMIQGNSETEIKALVIELHNKRQLLTRQ